MSDLKQRIESIKQKLSLEKVKQEIEAIEVESAKPEFWQDQQKAGQEMKRLAELQEELEGIDELDKLWDENQIEELEKRLGKFELKTFLSGRYDSLPAILSIHAGQGGTEAMDWAAMLKRMYARYFDKKGWSYSVIDEVVGDEAGIKSTTFKIDSAYSYGYLKYEAGTHRLVRQSPFNADLKRQTSFALVEVLPQLEEASGTEVKDEDIELQFFHSSSQGGQNVQKVSTAVRIKHKPSGIIVSCQSERYQEQNRKIALNLLKSKLWVLADARAKEEEQKLKGSRTMASWGTQIRSYVLHPYKMVKDLRTNWETSQAEKVLDGEIDELIEAELGQLS